MYGIIREGNRQYYITKIFGYYDDNKNKQKKYSYEQYYIVLDGDISFCTDSVNPTEYSPYWYGVRLAFYNGFIMLYDDDEISPEKVDDNRCWFKARKMSYKIFPL